MEEAQAYARWCSDAGAAAKRASAEDCRRRRPACRLRTSAPGRCVSLILASRLLVGVLGGPTIQPIEDVVIKACSDTSVASMACGQNVYTACQDGTVHLVLGHSDETLISSLQVERTSVTPTISAQSSPLRDVLIETLRGQRVITVCPRGKESGRSSVTIRVTDGQGVSVTTDFAIVVQPLTPVLDDVGPTRSVVDIRTIMGTSTYPYTFLVGHEDKDMVHRLKITAFSDKPLIIPNECCSDTPQFQSSGGIYLDMKPYQPTSDLSFVVGSLKAKARETTIVIRPAQELYGNVRLTLRLTDGNYTTLSTITVFVNDRPRLDKFCAYDVLDLDSLGSIADMFGMHWMTIFMMNNHTLTHPDNLTPGTRLSIGRPYIVKKSDSLYSIAVRYGTTWQHIHRLNPEIVPDEKNLFTGQLLCLAPDLAFITCRHGNQ